MQLVISVFTVIINIILGLFVFLKNPKGHSHRLLFLLNLFSAGWAMANYFSLNSPTPTQTMFWIRAVMFLTSPLGLFILLLGYTFPNEKIKLKKTVLTGTVFLTIIAMITSLTQYMFSSVNIIDGNIQPTPGPGLLVYAGVVLAFVFGGFGILIQRFRKSRGLKKAQLKFFVFGIIGTFALGIFTNFILAILFHASDLVILGPLFSLILVGSITYAIVKHRLMNINLVVARTVSWSLLLLIFATGYSLLIFYLTQILTGEIAGTGQILLYTSLSLITAFTFQPLRKFLEDITENIFFQDHYQTEELLNKVSDYLSASLNLEKLGNNSLNEILDKININWGSLIIIKNKKIVKTICAPKANQRKNINFSKISPLLETNQALIADEISSEKTKKILNNLDLGYASPLKIENKLFGLLLLGHKQSGDIYFDQDIDVLNILTPQIAVAIQNALSYSEIKKFSQTLEKKVKKATKELRNANQELQQLSKLKDEFVSLASHELRTPLTIINGYLSMLIDGDAGKLSKQAKELVDNASEGAQRMIRMVNNMLNISRIESGRLEMHISKINLEKICKEVVQHLQITAKNKNINLVYKCCTGKIPDVKADPDKLREVLNNLLSNAIKYTPKEGKIIISGEIKNKYIIIKITDTGQGISSADQKKLFKKFARLEKNGEKKQGTGLGLYISKLFIENMNGKIGVKSKLGSGSTFWFSLPIA